MGEDTSNSMLVRHDVTISIEHFLPTTTQTTLVPAGYKFCNEMPRFTRQRVSLRADPFRCLTLFKNALQIVSLSIPENVSALPSVPLYVFRRNFAGILSLERCKRSQIF